MLLQVENLRVSYSGNEVVKGVSFHLEKSEIFGIVGQSGSGKSTIARALTGLTNHDSGLISTSAKSIQMVFQDAVGSLNPRMKIEDTLKEAIKYARGGSGKTGLLTSKVDNLLELVGLSRAVLGQYPREMSGGQCQRVSIARALACNPEVLIADEPVSALDVSVQARVLNLLRDLRSKVGLSIILIAHDLAVVRNVCDRVAVMESGRFVEEGPADRVFSAPKSDYTARLLTAVPRI